LYNVLHNLKEHEVLKDVVEAYPSAASTRDCTGNLPLHSSLNAGKTWDTGIKEIFEAFPSATYFRDVTYNLFPFMLAALERQKSTNHQDGNLKPLDVIKQNKFDESSIQNDTSLMELTTIFELLQRDPCQVVRHDESSKTRTPNN